MESIAHEFEEWKSVAGPFDGFSYMVSNFGRVMSVNPNCPTPMGHIMKPWIGSSGYLEVKLSHDGVVVKDSIHRIVAYSFLPWSTMSDEVNHKDFNRLNNRTDNLEWVTRLGNVRHTVNALRHAHYESCGHSKLTVEQVREIRRKYKRGIYGYVRLGRDYGVSKRSIEDIVHNETWVGVA